MKKARARKLRRHCDGVRRASVYLGEKRLIREGAIQFMVAKVIGIDP